jgi:hypothetical protein
VHRFGVKVVENYSESQIIRSNETVLDDSSLETLLVKNEIEKNATDYREVFSKFDIFKIELRTESNARLHKVLKKLDMRQISRHPFNGILCPKYEIVIT